jgi:hypothetical protein
MTWLLSDSAFSFKPGKPPSCSAAVPPEKHGLQRRTHSSRSSLQTSTVLSNALPQCHHAATAPSAPPTPTPMPAPGAAPIPQLDKPPAQPPIMPPVLPAAPVIVTKHASYAMLAASMHAFARFRQTSKHSWSAVRLGGPNGQSLHDSALAAPNTTLLGDGLAPDGDEAGNGQQ